MKKIVIITLFSLFSAQGGEAEELSYAPPQQFDDRIGDYNDEISDFQHNFIPFYTPAIAVDGILPWEDDQDGNYKYLIAPLAKRKAINPLSDEDLEHAIDSLPSEQYRSNTSSTITIDYDGSSTITSYDDFDHESQLDLGIQQPEDPDTHKIASSSAKLPKKRSYSEAELSCRACRTPLKNEKILKRHEKQSKIHKRIIKNRKEGKTDKDIVVMRYGRGRYETAPPEKKQEYEKKRIYVQNESHNEQIWCFDVEKKWYTCLLCDKYIKNKVIDLYKHMQDPKHQQASESL